MLESATIRNLRGTMGVPLKTGDAGVSQTIEVMKHLVDDAVKDPAINAKMIEILRNAGVANFGVADRLQAVYGWISQPANFLYVPDPIGPFGPKETLRPARTLLQVKGGDCDDYTALLMSLLGTVGIRTRAVTIAADRSAPNDFSHIYPEAELRPGVWIPLDAARPGAAYGVAPPRYFRKRIWSLEDSSHSDVAAALAGHAPASRASSLNGYTVLGDDLTAQDISASTQGIANIISASQGNPYGSFATPYTPLAPAAGYPTPGLPGGGTGLTATLAGSSAIWWILGLAAVGLVVSGARGR